MRFNTLPQVDFNPKGHLAKPFPYRSGVARQVLWPQGQVQLRGARSSEPTSRKAAPAIASSSEFSPAAPASPNAPRPSTGAGASVRGLTDWPNAPSTIAKTTSCKPPLKRRFRFDTRPIVAVRGPFQAARQMRHGRSLRGGISHRGGCGRVPKPRMAMPRMSGRGATAARVRIRRRLARAANRPAPGARRARSARSALPANRTCARRASDSERRPRLRVPPPARN